jgi:hypothetical protein
VGDVPFITEPYTSIEQDIFVGKTDKEIVLDQVEEDLIFAAANCVDKFNSNNGQDHVHKRLCQCTPDPGLHVEAEVQ